MDGREDDRVDEDRTSGQDSAKLDQTAVPDAGASAASQAAGQDPPGTEPPLPVPGATGDASGDGVGPLVDRSALADLNPGPIVPGSTDPFSVPLDAELPGPIRDAEADLQKSSGMDLPGSLRKDEAPAVLMRPLLGDAAASAYRVGSNEPSSDDGAADEGDATAGEPAAGDSGETEVGDAPVPPAFTLPTPHGGPPLGRPIVVVSLEAEETRRIVEAALAAAAERDAQTVAAVAKDKVEEAFWVYKCHQRAMWGDR